MLEITTSIRIEIIVLVIIIVSIVNNLVKLRIMNWRPVMNFNQLYTRQLVTKLTAPQTYFI